MHEPDSRLDLFPIGLGAALALAPILVMFIAAQLLDAGVLAQPGGPFMVSITPLFFASALLIPIGLLIVGLAVPTDGLPRPIVAGAFLVVGVPPLLFVWFLVAIAFSGAAGQPF